MWGAGREDVYAMLSVEHRVARSARAARTRTRTRTRRQRSCSARQSLMSMATTATTMRYG